MKKIVHLIKIMKGTNELIRILIRFHVKIEIFRTLSCPLQSTFKLRKNMLICELWAHFRQFNQVIGLRFLGGRLLLIELSSAPQKGNAELLRYSYLM